MITKQARASFLTFLLLNFCFFSLQILFVYSVNGSFTKTMPFPFKVYLEQIITLGIDFGFYILLSLLQAILLHHVLKRGTSFLSYDHWQILIWTLCVCAILSTNIYFFPLSVFSKLFSPIPLVFIKLIMAISLLGISLLLLNSLGNRYVFFFVLISALFGSYSFWPHQNNPQAPHIKPNIIILGIDSLSPEHITAQKMPFLSQQLSQSVQFTNNISPLARTYPAWTSILTGLYVKNHHAEENLIAKRQVNTAASIVWQLNKEGYYSIYATDDRRFNNIDEQFGFKDIIGPKLGVNDILLGNYNDFPLSNLFINFPISQWLYPYNFMNRASFFSYYPQTFSTFLENKLHSLAPSPLFLAVHFALPHWPYAWAPSSPEELNNEFSLEKRDILYQKALSQVDKQVHRFFTYLQKNGYLTNSLVIFLSDHGEVLYYPNSRLTNYNNYQETRPSPFAEYLKRKTDTQLNKSAGHGSDILSPKQYHSLLAFAIYQQGHMITQIKTINSRTALIDIAPTLLAFLGQQSPRLMDGISLLPTILSSQPLAQRTFFIESGMCPNQKLSKKEARRIGKLFYQVNRFNNRLEVKSSQLAALRRQKLYGIIKKNWILALYPDETHHIAVIQNLDTGQWSDNLNSSFSQGTPAQELLGELHQFYGPLH